MRPDFHYPFLKYHQLLQCALVPWNTQGWAVCLPLPPTVTRRWSGQWKQRRNFSNAAFQSSPIPSPRIPMSQLDLSSPFTVLYLSSTSLLSSSRISTTNDEFRTDLPQPQTAALKTPSRERVGRDNEGSRSRNNHIDTSYRFNANLFNGCNSRKLKILVEIILYL